MHGRGRAAFLVVVILGAMSAEAHGEPVADCPPPEPTVTVDLGFPVKLKTSSLVTTDGGSVLRLPPGRFLAAPVWDTLDAELIRLQNTETRLTAENKQLRADLKGWQPGWRSITAVAITALAAGFLVREKL